MTKTILEKIKDSVAKYSMINPGDLILVGLSGGADSVCLLTLLHNLSDELKIELSAAYIDHGLRPEEIPTEIDFCSKFCSERNIRFTTRRIDLLTNLAADGINTQEAARILRYKRSKI